MSARIMLRRCRHLTTTLLSAHSSPFPKLHPRPPPPPPQPSATHSFLQTQTSSFPPHFHPHIPTSSSSSTITTFLRRFSSTSSTTAATSSPIESPTTAATSSPLENMKHQEIEGPTVEKDLSPLANETREVTNSLLKLMYNVSTFFALLGLSHLALGAYSYYTLTSASASASAAASASASAMSLMISAMAFGFPFAMAFMVRQSLKSMHFFQKMETIGRLQLLTSSMQIFKHLRVLFVRVRALSCLCLAGLSFSLLYSISSSI